MFVAQQPTLNQHFSPLIDLAPGGAK